MKIKIMIGLMYMSLATSYAYGMEGIGEPEHLKGLLLMRLPKQQIRVVKLDGTHKPIKDDNDRISFARHLASAKVTEQDAQRTLWIYLQHITDSFPAGQRNLIQMHWLNAYEN